LVIAGAVTFGTTYFFTLLAATIVAEDRKTEWDGSTHKYNDHSNDAIPLFIPVIGPAVGIFTLDADAVGTGWLVFDTIAQGAGAAMLVWGLTDKTKRWVRNDIGSVRNLQLVPGSTARGTPTLALSGSF
jgi:hypothetical protein